MKHSGQTSALVAAVMALNINRQLLQGSSANETERSGAKEEHAGHTAVLDGMCGSVKDWTRLARNNGPRIGAPRC
jgi:uncharacterized low-complexity protein